MKLAWNFIHCVIEKLVFRAFLKSLKNMMRRVFPILFFEEDDSAIHMRDEILRISLKDLLREAQYFTEFALVEHGCCELNFGK